MIDGSGSVGEDGFIATKQWIEQVSDGFDVESRQTQIGVVQYSHYWNGRYEFYLFIRRSVAGTS